MKPPIVTGETTDGIPVVYANLFQFKDQEGLPLDMAARHIQKLGYKTDWLYEIEGALWVGYTQERILSDLNEAFQLLYPGQHKALLGKCQHYFIMRETPNAYTLKAMKVTKP